MRYKTYLQDRYRELLSYIGSICFLVALTIASPLAVVLFYPSDAQHAWAFVVVAVPLALVSLALRRLHRNQTASTNIQEGMVVILISWLAAIFVSALPFWLTGQLDFTGSVFESTSGWTTVGLTVINYETTPRIFFFYRSVLQLVGGAGFAIIVITAITGARGIGLVLAEGRDDQVVPHVRQSAEIVINIYLSYTVLGIVALVLAGMPLFDAIVHTFSAVSTGGFSTQADSIGHYNNLAVELICIVLMILGATNFLTAYILLRGKVQPALHNGEIRLSAVMYPIAILALFAGFTSLTFTTTEEQLRVAIFETTSALTTTGFSITSYDGESWNDFGWLVMVLLMLIGGGSGSTAGGIKHIRIYLIIKAFVWDIQRTFLPDKAVNQAVIWRGEQRAVLTDTQIRRVALYTFVYLLVFLAGALVFTGHGYGLADSLFESASTLSSAGLSSGITSADAPPFVLWSQILSMFLGRLEFFAVIIGISKLLIDGRDWWRLKLSRNTA